MNLNTSTLIKLLAGFFLFLTLSFFLIRSGSHELSSSITRESEKTEFTEKAAAPAESSNPGIQASSDPNNSNKAPNRILERLLPSGPDLLSGTVKTRHGKVIPGATIIAKARGKENLTYSDREIILKQKEAYSCTSNAVGEFSLKDIPQSDYWVECHKEGYNKAIYETVPSGQTDLGFVLEPGALVRGKVVSSDHIPLEGALVVIDLDNTLLGGDFMSDSHFALTDVDGNFSLGPIPVRTAIWWVSAKYETLARKTVLLPPFDKQLGFWNLGEIILEKGGFLDGKVVAGSEPLGNAKVTAFLQESGLRIPFSASVQTSQDGKFQIDGAAVGRVYLFQVEKPGYIPVEGVQRGISVGESTIIRMEKSGSVEGDLLFPSDNKVEKATSVLVWTSGETGKQDFLYEFEIPAGEKNFQVENLYPGRFSFDFLNPSVQPAYSPNIHIRSGETTHISVSFERGRAVHGKIVYSSSKQPVVGARMQLVRMNLDGQIAAFFTHNETKTDEEGQFEIYGIPNTAGFVQALGKDFAAALFSFPESAADFDFGVLEVADGGLLVVKARGLSTPNDPSNLNVVVFHNELGFGRQLVFTTDGLFSSPHVPPGKYSLVVEDSFWDRISGRSARVHRQIEVEAGKTTEITVNLQEGPAVFGNVRQKNIPTVSGRDRVEVQLHQNEGGSAILVASSACDWNGRYELNGLVPGRYILRLKPLALAMPIAFEQEVILSAGERLQLDVDLSETGFFGRVVRQVDEFGIGVARISVIQQDIDRRATMLFPEEEGQFGLISVNPGRYLLFVEAPGYGSEIVGPITLVEGKSVDVGKVALRPEAKLDVIIRDSLSRAIRDAKITVQRNGMSPIADQIATTTAVGVVSFRTLAAANYTVMAEATGYPTIERQITLQPGEVRQLDLTLKAVSNLKITVLDAQGQPLSDVPIGVEELPNHIPVKTWTEAGFVQVEPTSWKTASDGTITLKELPLGNYLVRELGSNGSSLITLTASNSTLDIVLQSP